MKKIIVTLLAIATLALTLCSCATVECMVCHKKVSKDDAIVSSIGGEEYAVCNDCAGSLGGLLG